MEQTVGRTGVEQQALGVARTAGAPSTEGSWERLCRGMAGTLKTFPMRITEIQSIKTHVYGNDSSFIVLNYNSNFFKSKKKIQWKVELSFQKFKVQSRSITFLPRNRGPQMNVTSISSQLFYSADMGNDLADYLLLGDRLLILPRNGFLSRTTFIVYCDCAGPGYRSKLLSRIPGQAFVRLICWNLTPYPDGYFEVKNLDRFRII